MVGTSLSASKIGTTARSDGKPQVTYNGHPLYLYSADQKPGDTNGQGLNAFGGAWFALSAGGNMVSGRGRVAALATEALRRRSSDSGPRRGGSRGGVRARGPPLAGEAAVHVQQYAALLHEVRWIGPLFLANAAASVVTIIGLAYWRTRALAALAGVVISALALGSLVVSYGHGLFGWQEGGFRTRGRDRGHHGDVRRNPALRGAHDRCPCEGTHINKRSPRDRRAHCAGGFAGGLSILVPKEAT